MSEEHRGEAEKQSRYQGSAEAWQDVARQFETLGESLSAAFSTAWQDEATQEQLREMRDGLRSVANDFGEALDEALKSPEAQRAREEVEVAARSAQDAAQKAWEESEPQVVTALERVSAELRRLSERIRQRRTEAGPSEDEEF